MTPKILDLDCYMWKEPWTSSNQQEKRLLTPWSDVLEEDVNAIFQSSDKAYQWLEQSDLEEEAEEKDWVLVHYQGEVVGDAHALTDEDL